MYKLLKFVLNYINVEYQNEYHATALLISSVCEHFDIMRLLVHMGANINAQDETGWTALYSVAIHGHFKPTQMLINLGANVNICDNNGVSIMHMIAGFGHTAVLNLLNAHADKPLIKRQMRGGCYVSK